MMQIFNHNLTSNVYLQQRDLTVEVHHLRKQVADLKRRLGLRDSRIRQLEEEIRKLKDRQSKLPVTVFHFYALA